MSDDEPKFTYEAFKKAFDGLMKPRPIIPWREAFEAMSKRTRPIGKMIMSRSTAEELGVNISELPGNLVMVHGGKIEGMYVEPEEKPVEKRRCVECDDKGFVTEVDYSDGPNFPCFGDDAPCPYLHEPWHHPLP